MRIARLGITQIRHASRIRRSRRHAILAAAVPSAQSGPRARLVVGEGLHEPFAVDFDASGRMFIAEMRGNRVSVWDRGHADAAFDAVWRPAPPAARARRSDLCRRHVEQHGAPCRPGDRRGDAVCGHRSEGLRRRRRARDRRAVRLCLRHRDSRRNTLFIADLDNRRIRAVRPDDRHRRAPSPATATRACRSTAPTRGRSRWSTRAPWPSTPPDRSTSASAAATRCASSTRQGRIRTVAGTGEAGFGGDGGPALAGRHARPEAHQHRPRRLRADHRHREPRHPTLHPGDRHDRARRRYRREGRRRSRTAHPRRCS